MRSEHAGEADDAAEDKQSAGEPHHRDRCYRRLADREDAEQDPHQALEDRVQRARAEPRDEGRSRGLLTPPQLRPSPRAEARSRLA